MKKVSVLAVSLALILSFTVAATELKQAQVLKVYDVNTIGVKLEDGTTDIVKYIGIDTVEDSDKAKDFNKELVENGTVWLELGEKERNKKNLVLAYVYLDPARWPMVNATLLARGYAKASITSPNDKYADTFKELTSHAKEEGRGLWAEDLGNHDGVDERDATDAKFFEFDSDTGTITGYNVAGGYELVIPSRIDGVEVKEIGNEAFKGKHLTSVDIPDSVEKIGFGAFKENHDLTSVKTGDGVEVIESEAFYWIGLTSVELGNSVERIESKAFWRCDLTSVEIPDSVKVIQYEAFYECELSSVEIGDGVEVVGKNAFWGNKNLTSVKLGDGVEVIKKYAFGACYNLTSVELGDGVEIHSGKYRSAIEGNFKEVYYGHNKAAGVYVRDERGSGWYKKE